MSTEFNPMEGLLADLLSTWDEDPPEGADLETPLVDAAPVVVEVRPEPLTSSSPVKPEPPPVRSSEPLPSISALRPRVPAPLPVAPEPLIVATTSGIEPAANEVSRPEVVREPAIEPAPEPVLPAIAEPIPLTASWPEDPGAAAACAAILARMEREFAEREPLSLPLRKRLGTDTPRFVVFAVREMLFAVPIGRVLETDRMTPVTPLPGAAPGVKGLTNLRGEVVPVIDLREVLGWAPHENPSTRRMLVIQDGNRQPLTALLVDQVKGLAAFPATAWKSAEMAGAHSAEGFVEAVAEREDDWVSRLNLDRILNETHLPSLAAA
jgi:purine-binding chemotaxis protein CheW